MIVRGDVCEDLFNLGNLGGTFLFTVNCTVNENKRSWNRNRSVLIGSRIRRALRVEEESTFDFLFHFKTRQSTLVLLELEDLGQD